MTFKVKHDLIKELHVLDLCLHNVGNYIKLYQNRFINERVKDNLADIPQSHSPIDFCET